MGFTGLDGGIMVALAAGLWLVYLMPTWFKRREYAAVEKTEIRRQQALRVLEETTPIPVRERVEQIVTPTYQVTDRDKLAEAIERSRDAQVARMANRQIREESTVPAQAASARARIARRLRRTRAWVTAILLASLATFIVQIVLMVSTGIAAGAWTVLGFATVGAVVSFAALGRLASIARRRQTVTVPLARPVRTRIVEERTVAVAQPTVATWTPVPVPKPMYLSRSEAPVTEAAVDHRELLRLAALESDRALRAAQESPEITPITSPEQPLAAPSRYASMGMVETADAAGADLDEVLRRRRAS